MQSAVTDSIFSAGRILMPLEPTGVSVETVQQWSDSLVISTLVAFSALFVIVNIKNFVMVLPALFESFSRSRSRANLESRIVFVRARSICAITMILPFCLIADRFNLLPIEYLQRFSPAIHLAAIVAIFFVFIILRALINLWLRPKYRGHEAWIIGHRSGQTYFIIMTALELITVGILLVLGLEDNLIRTTLYYIIGVMYFVSIFRRIQILSSSCPSFTIILYLCALEFFPTGLLLAAARFL